MKCKGQTRSSGAVTRITDPQIAKTINLIKVESYILAHFTLFIIPIIHQKSDWCETRF